MLIGSGLIELTLGPMARVDTLTGLLELGVFGGEVGGEGYSKFSQRTHGNSGRSKSAIVLS